LASLIPSEFENVLNLHQVLQSDLTEVLEAETIKTGEAKQKKLSMRIDCYLSLGCASEEALTENIKRALESEAVEAEINVYRINEAEAKVLGLMGSPSVLINGRDILPGEIPGFS